MTLMTAMTMNGRGSLNGVRHSAVESRDSAMGREQWERKCDKARRYSRPTRPLGASIAQHTSLHEDLDLLLAEGILPLPVLADEVGGARRAAHLVVPSLGSPPGSPLAPSNSPRPGRSRPHPSYYDPSGCLRTIFPKVAIVFQKDHRDEMVDARAGGRSQTRRENPL